MKLLKNTNHEKLPKGGVTLPSTEKKQIIANFKLLEVMSSRKGHILFPHVTREQISVKIVRRYVAKFSLDFPPKYFWSLKEQNLHLKLSYM